MRRNILIFALVAAVLLVLVGGLTTVAYGANGPASHSPQIVAANVTAAPQTTFFGDAHGSITAGDLFYADITDSPGEVSATVYITNADNLAQYLKYLILQIGVYVKNADGGWDKSAQENGSYLTLQNSAVDITLPQAGYYKITVDSGNYFSFPNDNIHDKQMPQFYMAAVR